MEQFQELVGIVPWTLIATWANLLIIMLLMKKFLFKPVQDIMQKRQDAANALIADADKAKQDAEALQAQYTESLAGAKQEAAQIVAQANKTAALRSEETLNEAKEAATAIKQKAEAEIKQERTKALNDVKGEIGGMAMDIASKIVEREIKAEDHAALIDEFIENVGDAS